MAKNYQLYTFQAIDKFQLRYILIHMNKSRPNIIYILADDMGYGDISALNESSKIQTPNIDRIVHEGINITDAHSSSAVCTPSRYSILTGRYCWRTRLKEGVLFGASPSLMDLKRKNVASLLQENGYNTACIGKWHLGLDWTKKDNDLPIDVSNIDFSQPFHNGPIDLGFDYFFGISASLDMSPYVYLEQNKATAIPTMNRSADIFCREGIGVEDLMPEDVLPDLTKKTVHYIKNHSEDGPFFIYMPLNAPHTPIAPSKEFINKSGIGPYGDFCLEVDWSVGEILKALDQCKLADNTLIVFTSDNGCSPIVFTKENGNLDIEASGHHPSYHFRGYKSDIYEGGHRVPFVARWPNKIKKGIECKEPVGLTDFFATIANILDYPIQDNEGEDSFSLLPVFEDKQLDDQDREGIVHHSIYGYFSIRKGKWKLEMCRGSGGWGNPTEDEANLSELPNLQLYDMEKDYRETKNIVFEHPEIVEELTALLNKYIEEGRSSPGKIQKNDESSEQDIAWDQINWMGQSQ